MSRRGLRIAVAWCMVAAAATSVAAVSPLQSPQQVFDGAVADFRAGRLSDSAIGFDRLVELAPSYAPQLWQRGIALYYVGRYEDCREQFEAHRTVNPNDVENAAWHFLCVARAESPEAARAALLPVGPDARAPMAEIYRLFRGELSADELLTAAGDAAAAQFYAHLYLGLYEEAWGRGTAALEHIEAAADDRYAAVGGYMHMVAQVHLGARQDDYGSLLALFEEWRELERPRFVDGVPDYTSAAMAGQVGELAAYRARLEAIAIGSWPVAQQIDWHLVRAEMNGLDFDHRVRRPWANNPVFYVMIFTAESDVPAHEGPVIHGWVDTWTYDYPLSPADAAELAERIASIAPLLDQARSNLVGDGRDLWRMGVRSIRGQVRDLTSFGERVAGTSQALDSAVREAIAATDRFAVWLEQQLPSKNGVSGIGKDNYTWYLNNVHLVPYTWEEQLTLMRRELWRAHAALRLEENRNRHLPRLSRYQTAEEYDTALNTAVTEYMEFLEQEEILTIRDYMDQALRERIGGFAPPTRADGLRGFFAEVDYRDGEVMRTHGYHWFDLAQMRLEPHESPIRRVPALSNIYDARSEGMATGIEEMMMHAGAFDDRPRARELVWILLAQRAARAIGGLMQHGREWSLQEATEFASEWVPRGWLPSDGATIQGEEHFYLTQPGYGTSYLTGKIEIERLLAERAIQLGDAFTLKRFMDEFAAVGVIPVSMVRWELTGRNDETTGSR